jgi:hypothetical protein
MARLFQIPNFKRDEYQRPDQKWVCGRACDGKGCIFGPDPGGRCRTTGECQPVKEGDRWKCTRPDTHGGLCEGGPMPNGECCHQIGPCQPVLSLRALRGRWAGAAGILTVGLLLVLLGGSGRARWIDPGPLTSAHALSNTRCNDCHVLKGPGGDAGMGTLGAGLHGPSSAECLQCHDLGGQPLSPHGFDGATLASLHGDFRPAASASSHSAILAVARWAAPHEGAALECAACHREHRGRDGDLTGFTNAQCQVCHRSTFDSFSSGHPDFAGYPFERRTRIIFDHAKHIEVHFADKSVAAFAPKSCDACHVPSPSGAFMLVRPFEQACAACHGGQIEGEGRAGDKGIAFFRVPGLDAATLAGKGHPVGEWPSDADGRITPFMRLLLAPDPAATSALQVLGDADLSDLGGATAERLAAAETLAWSIKSLFADLVTDGQVAIISRLNGVAPGAPREQLRAMTAQLPRDGLISAQTAWFPNLFTEVANYRAGIRPAPVPAAPAKPNAPAARPPAAPSAGDDLLSDAPAPQAPAAPAPAAAPSKAAGDDLGSDDLIADSKPAAKPPVPAAAPAVAPLTVNNAEDWAVAGGWYRSADNFTLYYRPTGHADAFLAIWLTVAGRLSADPRNWVAQSLFTAMSDPKAPGLCAKCHSIDNSPSGDARIVNWHADQPRTDFHAITKFDHAAHFSLLSQQGCQTCHQLRPQGAYLTAFDGNFDPSKFESNFGSVSKATCANCHNDKVARHDCQLCHSYHTGLVGNKISETGVLRVLEKRAQGSAAADKSF